MSIDAGKLRHWVDIQEPLESRDSEGGVEVLWEIFARVPAAIEPLSAREFVAAQSVQSRVTTRITIRHLDGITAKMRIEHGSKIYNIEGILADKESGLEYITMPVSEGVNEG